MLRAAGCRCFGGGLQGGRSRRTSPTPRPRATRWRISSAYSRPQSAGCRRSRPSHPARSHPTTRGFGWRMRMCESGIEAVLIKVAALGLDPRKHLGRTLAEMEPRLNELCEMYDVNVCGEGGEYETLTLDCPLFTKARIRLEETEVVAFSERDASQGGMLKIRKYSLEPKGGASSVGESPVVDVTGEGPPSCPPRAPRPVPSGPLQARARFTCRGASCCTLSCELQLAPQSDAVQAATSALSEVGRLLAEEGMSWSDALFVSLYLHSMDLFGEVNLAYNKEVVRMCPPARACVELPLAQDTCLQLDVLVRSSPRRCGSTRRTLHVQSISEWAPPCIGPYSQGVAQDGLVFMAGQISLDPPSMKIVQGGIRAEVRQALQNCEAAAIALQTSLRGGLVSLTTFVSSEATANSGKVIEDEVQEFLQFTNNALNDEDSSAFTSKIWRLDSYIRPPCWESAPWVPVKLYLQVSRLPKGALVEFLPFAVQDENGLRSSLSSQTEHTEKWSVQFVTSASKILTGRAFLAFQDRQDSQFLTTAWLSETACEFSVLLIRVLGESCLSLNDVAVLKLYYTQVFASAAENLAEGVSSVLQAKLDGCLGGFSVNLVPVLKVGHTPDMSDTLALEFLAVKNPTF
mmetsp:Transcript_36445/g.86558  ORF Transcript_36445/g.86558 Transcript_36445/m.86558 type:complete len:631 (+) Transcript_36445:271-2163(+)